MATDFQLIAPGSLFLIEFLQTQEMQATAVNPQLLLHKVHVCFGETKVVKASHHRGINKEMACIFTELPGIAAAQIVEMEIKFH